jgi:ATP-dependent helicase Lhr and Lhr-like helicase
MDPLTIFHPIVREWFRRKFEAPTEAQTLGWPAIARGRHTLISAPTGSGKTLAAFLLCIDRLLRSAIKGDLTDSAQVVYVSPLKALSNDIHKNLSEPLQEIMQIASEQGVNIPEI